MTPNRKRDREALETRINNLSKEKRELLNLLLRQEALHESTLDQTPHPPHASLVAIQPFGVRPPLFCLPPVFGTVFLYYQLVPGLGLNQPVYGIRPRGMAGEAPPQVCMEDIASHAIEAIRAVQPSGPYHLSGYSFGGSVAFEVAQQLQASGHQVGLLALVSGGWLHVRDYISFLKAVRSQRQRHANHTPAQRPMVTADKDTSMSAPALQPMLRVYLANMKAWRHHVPKPYSHRIHLFRTGKPSRPDERDHTRGWSALTAGEVTVHWVPGNHLSVMRRPHVQVLAKALAACLDQGLPDVAPEP